MPRPHQYTWGGGDSQNDDLSAAWSVAPAVASSQASSSETVLPWQPALSLLIPLQSPGTGWAWWLWGELTEVLKSLCLALK